MFYCRLAEVSLITSFCGTITFLTFVSPSMAFNSSRHDSRPMSLDLSAITLILGVTYSVCTSSEKPISATSSGIFSFSCLMAA